MVICIAGQNEIAVSALELAISRVGAASVVVCPNKRDDGISRWQPSLRRFAQEWGIPLRSLSEVERQRDLVFLSVEFERIVVPSRFEAARLFNVHFSLLPRHKGMYTAIWPVLLGDTEAGSTLHVIDHGIDTGDLLAQSAFRVDGAMTSRDVYLGCQDHGIGLLRRLFDAMVSDQFTSVPQSSSGSTYHSKSSIDFSSWVLDFRDSAEAVGRTCRALSFREFQRPSYSGMPVTFAGISAERSRAAPGTLVRREGDLLTVACIDFDITLQVDRSLEVCETVQADPSGLNQLGDAALQGVDTPNSSGWTALMIAAFRGDHATCRRLLEIGADLRKTNQNGTTCLMYAASGARRSGDFSVCRLLLDHGADLYAADRFGRSLADYARIRGESEVLAFFGF